MKTSNPIIRTKALTRIYSLGAGKVTALNAIDLEIDEGELVVLKGNSGSGKSTLLSLLAGLDVPTSGELNVAGHDLRQSNAAELTLYRREVVGMVFQTFNLLPTPSVIENVCLPALISGRPYTQVCSKAHQYLEWLGMKKRQNHLPFQLSGGEMQRTAIARSLINDPKIILADEPTGNLDSSNGQMVMELLAELKQKWGQTLIIATHSELADPFATMRICLKDGQIIEATCEL
jgi:putative ABC transport system ATP-binding protein